MKKIIVLICMLFIAVSSVNAESDEKITVYMFRGTGCGACKQALIEFNSYEGKYDEDFDLVTIDVWGENENNGTLLATVIEKFDGDNSIPFFVIGDTYGESGFSDEVIETALAAKDDENYVDYLGNLINENKEDYELTNLEEASQDENIKYWDSSDSDTLIVVSIFLIVIGGITLLIILPNRKK